MNREKFTAFRPFLQRMIHEALVKEGIIEAHESVQIPMHINSDSAVQVGLSEVPFLEFPQDLDEKCATKLSKIPFDNRAGVALSRFVTLGTLVRCWRLKKLQLYGERAGEKALESACRVIETAGLSLCPLPVTPGPLERKVLLEAHTISVLFCDRDLHYKFPLIGDLVNAPRSGIMAVLRKYVQDHNLGMVKAEDLFGDIEGQMKSYGLTMGT